MSSDIWIPRKQWIIVQCWHVTWHVWDILQKYWLLTDSHFKWGFSVVSGSLTYPFSLVLMTFYKGHVAFLATCRWQSDQIISWVLFGKSKFNTVLFILHCLIRLFKILFNIISYINEVFTRERYILKWLKTKYNSVLIFPQPTIEQIPTHMWSNSSELQCLLYF